MRKFNLDKFANKVYDEDEYNCVHFLVDVWYEITGEDMLSSVFDLCTCKSEQRIVPERLKDFRRIDPPISPCVALLRGKTNTHVGVYLDNQILHISDTGMKYEPVHTAMIGFDEVRYYQYVKQD